AAVVAGRGGAEGEPVLRGGVVGGTGRVEGEPEPGQQVGPAHGDRFEEQALAAGGGVVEGAGGQRGGGGFVAAVGGGDPLQRDAAAAAVEEGVEIGRASCRERVEIAVVAGSRKE